MEAFDMSADFLIGGPLLGLSRALTQTLIIIRQFPIADARDEKE